MKKVSWGILSTANIGIKKVIPAMQEGQLASIDAICSRDLSTAQKFADQTGIKKAYGSYEELLADPSIDAIYNPLPNHLHVPWTIKALEAGKHVLCEKPIGLDVDDTIKLVESATKFPNLKVMEAFMYRFHPQWVLAKEWVKLGKIGSIKGIQSVFAYHNVDPNNVRNMADIGGGGMLDIGCYCISMSRFITDMEPKRVSAVIDRDPVLKTDRMASCILDFGDFSSSFVCSTQMSPYQRVNIIGDLGRIEIEIPFNAPIDEGCIVHLISDGSTETISTDAVNQYTLQGELFSKAILEDLEVPTPLGDALNNMKVIDAVFAAADSNSWVKI